MSSSSSSFLSCRLSSVTHSFFRSLGTVTVVSMHVQLGSILTVTRHSPTRKRSQQPMAYRNTASDGINEYFSEYLYMINILCLPHVAPKSSEADHVAERALRLGRSLLKLSSRGSFFARFLYTTP